MIAQIVLLTFPFWLVIIIAGGVRLVERWDRRHPIEPEKPEEGR